MRFVLRILMNDLRSRMRLRLAGMPIGVSLAMLRVLRTRCLRMLFNDRD